MAYDTRSPGLGEKGLWNIYDIQKYLSLETVGMAQALTKSGIFPAPVQLPIQGAGDLWRADDVKQWIKCLRWDALKDGRHAE